MIAQQLLANLLVLGVLPALGWADKLGKRLQRRPGPRMGNFALFGGETWKLPSPQDMKHQEVID